MEINLLLEHIGMIHFLESLVDKKYNWQILLPNWLYMIPKAVNDWYNHITDDICFSAGILRFRFKIKYYLAVSYIYTYQNNPSILYFWAIYYNLGWIYLTESQWNMQELVQLIKKLSMEELIILKKKKHLMKEMFY